MKKSNSGIFCHSIGIPLPFGVHRTSQGHNFSLFSPDATEVTLEIFTNGKSIPTSSYSLSKDCNKTGNVWHIQLHSLPDHFYYSYRINGQNIPHQGIIFDARKRLIDPYAKAISGMEQWGKRSSSDLLNYYSEVQYDWEGDRPINRSLNESIIYELHVRGFTQSDSSQAQYKGTYRGITEQIEHFKQLGITAIELLPIHEFDEMDCPFVHPEQGLPIKIYGAIAA